MLSANLYSPQSLYDLNNDAVTKTLNKLQKYGLDLRSSLLVRTIEKITDNTDLSKISYERYAAAAAVKAADNLAHKFLPSVNLDNLFSNDPNKKLFTKNKDWSITTQKDASLVDHFRSALGVLNKDEIQTLFGQKGNRESQAGGTAYYEHMGAAQKQQLTEQLRHNDFNRFASETNVGAKGTYGGFKNTNAMYAESYIADIKNTGVYTSYIRDHKDNATLSNVREIETLKDAIISRDVTKDVLIKEGFGLNRLGKDESGLNSDESIFLTYLADENHPDVVPLGFTQTSKLNAHEATRGLLYYTQQIVQSGAEAGKNIAHETKKFAENRDGSILYKGSSECRSYTIYDRYDNAGKLMRFAGNGHEYSVLKDSVMPKIYPKTSADTRTLMFSIENLAFTSGDLLSMKAPETQFGPNGGRIMWFPPYGLQFSDNSSPNIEETHLLGRIEPVYTYSGTKRDMALSFTLIVDTPPNVHDYDKSELAAWFAGCIENPKPPVKPQLPPQTLKSVLTVDATPVPKPADTEKYASVGAQYYFENDQYTIFKKDSYFTLDRYEYYAAVTASNDSAPADPLNMLGLNEKFGDNLRQLLEWSRAKIVDGYEVSIDIAAKCSALWKDDYNAVLSYRRANALMHYIVASYNELYGHQGMLEISDPRATAAFFGTDVKLSHIKNKPVKSYEFQTTDKLMKFKIYGLGEEYSQGYGDKENQINLPHVKKMRTAYVNGASAKYVGTANETLGLKPVTSSYEETLRAQQAQDEATSHGEASGSRKDWFHSTNSNGVGAMGWDKVDYYKPAFHSQTPYNFHERVHFLKQLDRPRNTIDKMDLAGSNSLFGKMPVCVLRIGDFVHARVIVRNVNIDYTEITWDMNPEGMGMQPLIAKVTMDLSIVGGMSMEQPIRKLLTATDFNQYANSNYYDNAHYSPNRFDYQQSVRPANRPDPNDPSSFKVYDPTHPANIKTVPPAGQ